jgi:AcrR family transcriptional regulator
MVNMHPARTPRRTQARTEATKSKILDAAQALFSHRGFENTQLDEIASLAGCSRGGIYAHYENKEDLFLALMRTRVSKSFQEAWSEIEREPDLKRRRSVLKRWFTQQVCSPEAGTLTLEFKLYAVRRPEKRAELLEMYNSLFAGSHGDPLEVMFGRRLTKAARLDYECRLSILGGTLSSLILEGQFRPDLLTSRRLAEFTDELLEALLPS